jgi:hypothetical protein
MHTKKHIVNFLAGTLVLLAPAVSYAFTGGPIDEPSEDRVCLCHLTVLCKRVLSKDGKLVTEEYVANEQWPVLPATNPGSEFDMCESYALELESTFTPSQKLRCRVVWDVPADSCGFWRTKTVVS